MEALPKPRRKRYERAGPPERLSPTTLQVLPLFAEFPLLSAALIARMLGRSLKGAQRSLRPLFDAGLLDVVSVPRIALAMPTDAPTRGQLFGSAPNLFTLSKRGARRLLELGQTTTLPERPQLSQASALFVAHQLLVAEIHAWVWLAARGCSEHTLEAWFESKQAAIHPVARSGMKSVYPDARFLYRIEQGVLSSLVEADRGTMRGHHWREKLTRYAAAFESDAIRETTGYRNARLLIVTTSPARVEQLCQLVEQHAAPILKERCWIAPRSVLDTHSLGSRLWRRPGNSSLWPLLEVGAS